MEKLATHLISINGYSAPTLLDWTSVEDEIRRLGKPSREIAFLSLVLDHLFDLNSGTIRHWITEGGNDRGIDAIVVDDVERRVHLITTKCVKNFDKATHNFPSAEVDKALTFVDDLLRKSPSLGLCNPVLAGAVKDIWECMNVSHHTLHFHACSNQAGIVSSEKKRIELNLRSKRVTFEEHHLQAFSADRARATKSTNHKLEFAGEKIERDLGNARTVTGYVSLAEVATFLTSSDGHLNQALFNANIRDFLGAKTPINRQIAKTLNGVDRELSRY